tara:strand:- start:1385 stop:1876 length:492 start_codon:yes stop_codon:yes gene_type:complete
VAKDILLQSMRLEDLLVPFDRLATQLQAAESSENATLLSAAAELLGGGGLAAVSPPSPPSPPSSSPSPPVASVCFPADVLRPLASLTEDLAAAKGVTFVAVIDQELPGLRVPEVALREAVRCCTLTLYTVYTFCTLRTRYTLCTRCALCTLRTLCTTAPLCAR